MLVKQKLLRIFGLILTIYLSTSALWAATNVTVGGLKYQIDTSTGTAIVMGASSTSGSGLTIPGTITYNNVSYRVTTINERAFRSSSITGTLKIEEGVVVIKDEAFQDCKFDAVILPSTLSSIGFGAFKLLYSNIKYFRCYSTIPPKPIKTGYTFFLTPFKLNTPLQIPKQAISSYQSAFEWNGFKTIVEIPTEPTKISLDRTDAMIEEGESITLTTTILPAAAADASVTWSTSNSAVATVSKGTVKAVKAGTATITAKTENGLTAKCVVKVVAAGPFKYRYNASTKTATVIGLKSTVTALKDPVIPEVTPYKGDAYKVVAIGTGAFVEKTEMTGSLTVSNSVTTIGGRAFDGCSGLDGSLTIGKSVTEIGSYAFNECSGLTGSLVIPNSVTEIGEKAFWGCSGFDGTLTLSESLTTIENYVFNNCNHLTGSLTIPNSVTSIGGFAFSNCSGFNGTLTIPNTVTSIGGYAFSNCCGFTGSLTIPNSVTTLEYFAFNSCSGFSGSLTLSESITTIESSTFSGCSGFTGSLTIPNSVTSIGSSAFSDCSGFDGTLTIGESVTNISIHAFYGCSGFIGDLSISESVTNIGRRAFEGCSGFSGTLTLPSNVSTIGYEAFFNTNFNQIVSNANEPPITGLFLSESEPPTSVSFNDYKTPLFVPIESVQKYKDAYEWKKFYSIKGIGYVDATGIVLDAESAVLNAGETLTLTATVYPEDATDKSVSWTSSDESVATVTDGVVTGLKPGMSTITAATVNGLTATCEVTVCLLGDVNGDGVVNVADVVATTNYIAGNEVLNFNAVMADINGDGEITVSDAVLIAQIILAADARSTDVMSRSRAADMNTDCLEVLDNGSSVELSLSSDVYSAFQADVVLPAGVEFAGARLVDGAESTHTVMTAVKEGNMVRLVVFSLANADFNGTVELQLTGTRHDDGTVEVYNAVASDAAGRSRSIGADVNKGVAGIYDINAQGNIGIEPIPGGVELTGAEGMRYSIYTTTGVSVATREAVSDRETVELPAGIYIVTVGSKTRKVVVR